MIAAALVCLSLAPSDVPEGGGDVVSQVVPEVISLSAFVEEHGSPLHRVVSARFVFFDAPVGGAALFMEEHAELVVEDGELVVEIGAQAGNPLPPLLFDGPRWLEVMIDRVALAPRARVAAVPHALSAAHARECETLAGLGPEDVATRGALATPGATPVSFANLVDVPAPLRAMGEGVGGVDRGAVAGDEVPLFLVPSVCPNRGTLTLSDTCVSSTCDGFYRMCDGSCSAALPQHCPTQRIGWLLAP